ncbi:MAG: molybdopterin-binding protein [Paracoccaceae bacterium]
MKFGPVSIEEALGAILAHSMPLQGGKRLRKGLVLGSEEIEALQAAGHTEITVARLEASDTGEDEAARRLAAAMVPDAYEANLRIGRASTGRVNLHAIGPGVLTFDASAIAAANQIDPMITIATLPPFARVWDRGLVATIKVISYGISRASLRQAEVALQDAMRVRPVIMRTATLIETVIPPIPGAPNTARDPEATPQAPNTARDPEAAQNAPNGKGEAAIRARLERLGMRLSEVITTPHETEEIAQAIAGAEGDVILILTASATSDLRDTAPEAVRMAGGQVTRFGMPVDPGNLLFTGGLGAVPIIGLPGCARSPALNGADWVLERVVCGVAVTDADIAAMGIGGLLKEIPQRGRLRES